MSTKQVATKFVTAHYCDICGKEIDDGLDNGMGGPHFLGAIVTLQKLKLKGPTTLELGDYQNSTLILRVSTAYSTEKYYEVCASCAQKIIAGIEAAILKFKESQA